MKDLKVLLLAAGFGKRLGQLTQNCPKPLLPLGSHRIIDFALWQLKVVGLTEITINLHYLGQQISDYLGDGSSRGLKITYSPEDPILDTGGPIKRAMLQNPGHDLLVYNSDNVFGKNLDLTSVINNFYSHPKERLAMFLQRIDPRASEYGPITTVKKSGYHQVVKILDKSLKDYDQNKVTSKSVSTDSIFTGIHLVSKNILPYFNQFPEAFHSMHDLYPHLLARNELITADFTDSDWCDIGTTDRLAQAQNLFTSGKLHQPIW